MADYIRRVLTGDVTNLPGKESNIVRIFTSSTFTGNIIYLAIDILFIFRLNEKEQNISDSKGTIMLSHNIISFKKNMISINS